MGKIRGFMARHYLLLQVYRALVFVVGLVCVVAGIIMLVTPGPGWLAIFLGLGLWGTEFSAAHRLNLWGRRQFIKAWQRIEHHRHERHRRQTRARWQGRTNKEHFCPSGVHYHGG